MTTTPDMSDFNRSLFERMQDMNKSWLESLREIRKIESDFGSRLLIARNPAEATSVCNAWMTKRLETIANEQQAFATAWLALVSDVMSSTFVPNSKTSKQVGE